MATLWGSSSYDLVKTDWSSAVKTVVFHLANPFNRDLINEFIMDFSVDVNLIENVIGLYSRAGVLDKPSLGTAKSLYSGNAKEALLPGVETCGGVPLSCGRILELHAILLGTNHNDTVQSLLDEG